MKLVMKLAAALTAVALPLGGGAWEAPTFHNNLVVKVISRLKDGGTVFQGSGLIARKKGKVYVVTSDHVVLQSDEKATHEIYIRGSDVPNPCTIVMTHYTVGLTLLTCEMKTHFRAYEFWSSYTGVLQGSSDIDTLWFDGHLEDDPSYFKDTPGYSLQMIGYPMDSFELSRPPRVETNLVFMRNSPFYPGLPVMVRVNDGQAEKGMSGGILVSERENRITLHGFLAYRVGPDRFASIYVIPAAAGAELLRLATEYPQYRHDERIRQEVRHQLRGPFDVLMDRYDFETYQTGKDDQRHYLIRVRKMGKTGYEPPKPQLRGWFEERHFSRHFETRKDCAVYIVGVHSYERGSFRIRSLPAFYASLLEGFARPHYGIMCPQTKETIRSLPALKKDLDAFLADAGAKRVDSKLLPVLAAFSKDLRFFVENPDAAEAAYPKWMMNIRQGDLDGDARVYGTWAFREPGLEPRVLELIRRSEAALAQLTL